MTTAIELRGAGKRYLQTDQGDATLLRRVLRAGRRNERRGLWALRDIDLTVDQGETIGVIGRNGSGKTTLLRLLSGSRRPSVGRLRVVGRIAPLIGVGVGFNPELTGRENVLANGRLLGLGDAEIRRDFDAIVEFSEIEQFVDSPVKFYSSGMFLRLAFAVAIHTEPEVLAPRRDPRRGGPRVPAQVHGPDARDPGRGHHDRDRDPQPAHAGPDGGSQRAAVARAPGLRRADRAGDRSHAPGHAGRVEAAR